ncbi:TetR/AcrR family transcriptional regulator [Halobacillus sp. Cin3]|uniref:TetR/AcrR family transcriptional regulator n=1 Tax=Halobacillus sp. Cin3 TaxID=2928441 RepID=UPI00248DFA49|nr:TetR/AcrR family transcriptional regulator [Halobacillus sp. Cin3]
MSEKKQQIIWTAAKLIHAKGYESTKLSDILAACGIGKGQFYHYFTSKRELGLAIVDHYAQMWQDELIEGILKSGRSPERKMEEMLQWAIQFHETPEKLHGCPFGNLALEMSEHDEDFRVKINRIFSDWIEELTQVIEALQGEKQARQKARMVVAQIEGAILLMKNNQDSEVLLDIIDGIRQEYISS